MVNIRIFNHVERGVLACRGDALAVKDRAKAIVKEIEYRIQRDDPDGLLRVSSLLINDLAQLHADKWVENIALHVGLYSTAIAAPRMSTPTHIYNDDSIQKIKSFSGDVSGVIGETLLTVIMQRCYGLDDECVAHFRAHKSVGIYPDFGIFFATEELCEALKPLGVKTRAGFLKPAIPCEVKTITTMNTGEAKERVIKAIGQIQSYWLREKTDGVSLLCIAIRNPAKLSYDVNLIWCI
jgi:hypothetical protein